MNQVTPTDILIITVIVVFILKIFVFYKKPTRVFLLLWSWEQDEAYQKGFEKHDEWHLEIPSDALLAPGAIINMGDPVSKTGFDLIVKNQRFEHEHGVIRLQVILDPESEITPEDFASYIFDEWTEGVEAF